MKKKKKKKKRMKRDGRGGEEIDDSKTAITDVRTYLTLLLISVLERSYTGSRRYQG